MTDNNPAEFEAVFSALCDLSTPTLKMLSKDYSAEPDQTVWTQFIATAAQNILAARDAKAAR
jgi:hypothetical protein